MMDERGMPDGLDSKDEKLEQEEEPWIVISVEDFYDLLMEQQEQM